MASICSRLLREPRRADEGHADRVARVRLIEPRVFGDDRGFFFESWNARALAAAGIDADVRAGQSLALAPRSSARPPLPDRARARQARARGRRRSLRRRVDLRRSSPTFGRAIGVALSAENRECCGCRRDSRTASSRCPRSPTSSTRPPTTGIREHERTLLWNDPALGIEWPLTGPPSDRQGCRGNAARAGRNLP